MSCVVCRVLCVSHAHVQPSPRALPRVVFPPSFCALRCVTRICSCPQALGYTALHAAAKGGHTAVVKALLAAGADKAATGKVGVVVRVCMRVSCVGSARGRSVHLFPGPSSPLHDVASMGLWRCAQ